MARLHVFIVTNWGILIETFTGTNVRALLYPERIAARVNAYNTHPMQLLGMKLVDLTNSPAFPRLDGRPTLPPLALQRFGNDAPRTLIGQIQSEHAVSVIGWLGSRCRTDYQYSRDPPGLPSSIRSNGNRLAYFAAA